MIVGSLGLAAHLNFFFKCVGDKAIALKFKAKSEVVLVANSGIRRQFNYSIVQAGMIALGINAMTAPPNLSAATSTSTVGGIIIIGIELFLIANALTDQRDRNRLLAIIGGRRATDNR